MRRVAVIGAGISGLASAQVLKDHADVVVFEREGRPGGLIRCETVDGALFHLCGGHVFNTKDEEVAQWFWRRFERDRDFLRRVRHLPDVLIRPSSCKLSVRKRAMRREE